MMLVMMMMMMIVPLFCVISFQASIAIFCYRTVLSVMVVQSAFGVHIYRKWLGFFGIYLPFSM